MDCSRAKNARKRSPQHTLWRQVQRETLPEFVKQFYGVSQVTQQRNKVKRSGQPVRNVVPPVVAVEHRPDPVVAPQAFPCANPVSLPMPQPTFCAEMPSPMMMPPCEMPVVADEVEIPCATEPCRCEYYKHVWSYKRHACHIALALALVLLPSLFSSLAVTLATLYLVLVVFVWFSWPAKRVVDFECLTCVLDRVCSRVGADRQLLSFAFRTLFMTSRDQSRWRELKLRLEAQMRIQHEDWSQEQITSAILLIIRGVSRMFEHEMQWVETVKVQLVAMEKAHQFARTGEFSGGRQLPQA
jgi:hypothetical protein